MFPFCCNPKPKSTKRSSLIVLRRSLVETIRLRVMPSGCGSPLKTEHAALLWLYQFQIFGVLPDKCGDEWAHRHYVYLLRPRII